MSRCAALLAGLLILAPVSASAKSYCQALVDIATLLDTNMDLMNQRRYSKALDVRVQAMGLPFDLEPSAEKYLNPTRVYTTIDLDLDLDGKADSVRQNCGDGRDPTCFIQVALTTGRRYEVQTGSGSMYRLNDRTYFVSVVETQSASDSPRTRIRFHRVGTKGFDRVCSAREYLEN